MFLLVMLAAITKQKVYGNVMLSIAAIKQKSLWKSYVVDAALVVCCSVTWVWYPLLLAMRPSTASTTTITHDRSIRPDTDPQRKRQTHATEITNATDVGFRSEISVACVCLLRALVFGRMFPS